MSKDTGGPAFPTSNGGSPDDGVTKRELFAAMAMQGLITKGMEDGHKKGHMSVPTISTYAVEYADALIAELAK